MTDEETLQGFLSGNVVVGDAPQSSSQAAPQTVAKASPGSSAPKSPEEQALTDFVNNDPNDYIAGVSSDDHVSAYNMASDRLKIDPEDQQAKRVINSLKTIGALHYTDPTAPSTDSENFDITTGNHPKPLVDLTSNEPVKLFDDKPYVKGSDVLTDTALADYLKKVEPQAKKITKSVAADLIDKYRNNEIDFTPESHEALHQIAYEDPNDVLSKELSATGGAISDLYQKGKSDVVGAVTHPIYTANNQLDAMKQALTKAPDAVYKSLGLTGDSATPENALKTFASSYLKDPMLLKQYWGALAGATSGLIGLIPQGEDLISSALNSGTTNSPFMSDEDKQKDIIANRMAVDNTHRFTDRVVKEGTGFTGTDTSAPSYKLGEFGSMFLLPAGAESKLSELTARLADAAVEKGVPLVGKGIDLAARAAKALTPAAAAAGEVAYGGTHGVAAAAGTLLAKYGGLEGLPMIGGTLSKLKNLVLEKPFDIMSDAAKTLAETGEDGGKTVLESLQNSARDEWQRQQQILEDLKKSNPDDYAQATTPNAAKGSGFLYKTEELSKNGQKIRDVMDKIADQQKRDQLLGRYVNLNKVISDGVKYGIGFGANTAVGTGVMTALTGASAPLGKEDEAMRGATPENLVMGALGALHATPEGRSQMVKSDMIKIGKKFINAKDVADLPQDVQDYIHMHAAMTSPFGTKYSFYNDPSPDAARGFYQNGTITLNKAKIASGGNVHEALHGAADAAPSLFSQHISDIASNLADDPAKAQFAKTYMDRMKATDVHQYLTDLAQTDPARAAALKAGPASDLEDAFNKEYSGAYKDLADASPENRNQRLSEEYVAEQVRQLLGGHGPRGADLSGKAIQQAFGGKGGRQIISDWFKKAVGASDDETVPIQNGFGGEVSGADARKIRDAYYKVGEAAKKGRSLVEPSVEDASTTPPNEPTAATVAPATDDVKARAAQALNTLKVSKSSEAANFAHDQLVGEGVEPTEEAIVARALKNKSPQVEANNLASVGRGTSADIPTGAATGIVPPANLVRPSKPAKNLRIGEHAADVFKEVANQSKQQPGGETLADILKKHAEGEAKFSPDGSVGTLDQIEAPKSKKAEKESLHGITVQRDRKVSVGGDGSVSAARTGTERVFLKRLVSNPDEPTPLDAQIQQRIPEEQRPLVGQIQSAIDDGKALNISHNSKESQGFNVTGRQRAQELRDPNRERTTVNKTLQPIGWEAKGDEIHLLGQSFDKVIANFDHLQDIFDKHGDDPRIAELRDDFPFKTPEELRDGLKAYYGNQSQNLGGHGKPLDASGLGGLSRDAFTPAKGAKGTPLSDNEVQALNMLQGESGKSYSDVAQRNRPAPDGKPYADPARAINPMRDRLDAALKDLPDAPEKSTRDLFHSSTETVKLRNIPAVHSTDAVPLLPRGQPRIARAGFSPDSAEPIKKGTAEYKAAVDQVRNFKLDAANLKRQLGDASLHFIDHDHREGASDVLANTSAGEKLQTELRRTYTNLHRAMSRLNEPYEHLIIGAGPSGLRAAVHSGYEGLRTIVIDALDQVGGQARTSREIKNAAHTPAGQLGREFFDELQGRALNQGVEFRLGSKVVDITTDEKTGIHTVHMGNGDKLQARNIQLGTGASPNKKALQIPGIEHVGWDADHLVKLLAQGKKDFAVMGAGNSSTQSIAGLVAKANKFHLINRSEITGEKTKMSNDQFNALVGNPAKVEIHAPKFKGDPSIYTRKIEKLPDGKLRLHLQEGEDGPMKTIDVDGAVNFLGTNLNTDWLPKSIKRNSEGAVVTGPEVGPEVEAYDAKGNRLSGLRKVEGADRHAYETTVPKIYAGGDITRVTKKKGEDILSQAPGSNPRRIDAAQGDGANIAAAASSDIYDAGSKGELDTVWNNTEPHRFNPGERPVHSDEAPLRTPADNYVSTDPELQRKVDLTWKRQQEAAANRNSKSIPAKSPLQARGETGSTTSLPTKSRASQSSESPTSENTGQSSGSSTDLSGIRRLSPDAPVEGFDPDFKPSVPDEDKVRAALNAPQQAKWQAHLGPDGLKAGDPVAARIDIPAFTRHGQYAITVHEPKQGGSVGAPIGYDNMITIDKPSFFVNQDHAKMVHDGKNKFPLATVEGEFNPSREIPKDITDRDVWTPVGFNPKDHSYYYDKATGKSVQSGEQAISVGNTVYVKDAKFADKSNYKYSPDSTEADRPNESSDDLSGVNVPRGTRTRETSNNVRYMPSPHPEAITSAAIKDTDTGKVYTGAFHPEIWDNIPNKAKYKIDAEDDPWNDPNPGFNSPHPFVDGFVDRTGKFHDREEAHAHALKIGQMTQDNSTPDGNLESNHLAAFDEMSPRKLALEKANTRFMPAPPPTTPEFKNWFKDSKVVDDEGKPKIVIHGTASDFSKFSRKFAGTSTKQIDTGIGFFFTEDPQSADYFAKYAGLKKSGMPSDEAYVQARREHPYETPEGAAVMPAVLSIQHPFVMQPKEFYSQVFDHSFFSTKEQDRKANNNWAEGLQERGYDGIQIKGGGKMMMGRDPNADVWVAFKPQQVKSAIANRGTWSPRNTDITYSPSPHPDAIDDTAIKTPDGKIWTGRWANEIHNPGMNADDAAEGGVAARSMGSMHSEIESVLPDKYQGSDEEPVDLTDGFVTKTGRFLNRREAFEHASQIKQLKTADYQKDRGWYLGRPPESIQQLEGNSFDDHRKYSPDSEDKGVMAAVNPGADSGWGGGTFDPEHVAEFTDTVLHRIAPNGTIKAFDDAGIENHIERTIGEFGGTQEPSFLLHLPKSSFEETKHVAAILGDALHQDAAIAVDFNPKGSQFGIFMGDKASMTPEKIKEFRDFAQRTGTDFTLHGDGAVIFDPKMFGDGPYTEDDFAPFANHMQGVAKELKLPVVTFRQNSDYISHGDYADRIKASLGAGKSPDLLQGAVRDLYRPSQEEFSKFFHSENFEPTGEAPIDRLRRTIGDYAGIQFSPDSPVTPAQLRAKEKRVNDLNKDALPVRYKTDDDGKPKLDPKGNLIPKQYEYDFENTPVAKAATKGIKDPEKKKAAAASAIGDTIVDEYDRIKDNPEVMAAKGWYQVARDKIKKVTGSIDDAVTFARLLAATSAQTGVIDNYKQAIDAFNQIKSGAFDGLGQKYLEYRDAADRGELTNDSGEKITRAKLRKFLDEKGVLPKKANGAKYNMNSEQVLRVLADVWHKEAGLKTANFAGNLSAGGTLRATIDVWAARNLRRLAGGMRIQPTSEKGVSDKDFRMAQDAFDSAAEKLKMNPDDLQAIMWFNEKKLWDQKGWTNRAGAEMGDYREMLDYTKHVGDHLELHVPEHMMSQKEKAALAEKRQGQLAGITR